MSLNYKVEDPDTLKFLIQKMLFYEAHHLAKYYTGVFSDVTPPGMILEIPYIPLCHPPSIPS